MTDPAQREETHWPALVEEALQLLQDEGFRARGAEAQDLLMSHGASRDAQGRLRVRTARSREALARVPDAFNLHDRDGHKIATLAGGARVAGSGVIFATAPTAAARWRDSAGEPRPITAADLWHIAAETARLPGFAVQGTGPLPLDLQPPVAELLRLYVGLCSCTHPHLVRVRHGDAVESIWNLLRALRGDARAVEQRPAVILEVSAGKIRELSAPVCRILTDAARHGLPLAIRLPAIAHEQDVPGGADAAVGDGERRLTEIVSTAVAAILVHQTARARAPLLWSLPPVLPGARPAAERDAWATLLGIAETLALPTVATAAALPISGTLLSAAHAASRGARMIVLGGDAAAPDDPFDPTCLSEIATRLPDIAATAAHPPLGTPDVRCAPISESQRHKLAEVLVAEAARRGAAALPLETPA